MRLYFSEYKVKGFSLIELMVVVMVLAIMATFAMQFYQPPLDDAKRAKANQDLNGIKRTIKIYYVQTGGQYPPSIDSLIGKYLVQEPKDPWGYKYQLDTEKLEVYCIDRANGSKISVRYGRK